MKNILACIIVILILLFLGACNFDNQIAIESSNNVPIISMSETVEPSRPTITSVPIRDPTKTIVPTPTALIVPTYSPDVLAQNLVALNNPECVLPCFLGITPGKTTFDQANEIFIDNDWRYIGETNSVILEGNKTVSIYYAILIDYENIHQRVNLYILDNVVIGMQIHMHSVQQSMFSEFATRFYPVESFRILGTPDEIFVLLPPNDRFGGDMVIYYENLGLWIKQSSSRREDTRVCTNQSSEVISRLKIEIYDPFYFQSPQKGIVGIYTTINLWGTIEDVLGVSKEEFVAQALLNNEVCYQRRD